MSLWKWLFGFKPSGPENIASSKPLQAEGRSAFAVDTLRKGDMKSWDEPYGHNYAVDIGKDGIRVDGVLLPDMTVAAFAKAFGEPRIVEYITEDDRGRKFKTLAIWDDAGVYAYVTSDAAMVNELVLLFTKEEKHDAERNPREVFLGKLTIDGKTPLDAIPEEKMNTSALLDVEIGQWDILLFLHDSLGKQLSAILPPILERDERKNEIDTGAVAKLIRSSPTPFDEVTITRKRLKVPREFPKPTGETLSFTHFPFKLAIVQELMYEQKRLTPEFDVTDFVENYIESETGPEFDYSAYTCEMLPEAQAWFRDLLIPTALAEHVKRLYLDGSNDIYLELIPQWDGKNDPFRITEISEQELMQFPNLRHVKGAGWLATAVRKFLIRHGIEVAD